MLKVAFVCCLVWLCGDIFSRDCDTCNVALFTYDFLNLPIDTSRAPVFHNIPVKDYNAASAADAKVKRTEDYQFLHNGDYFKGAEDIFGGDFQGSGWLKNFDFGKFASVVFEVSRDSPDRKFGLFQWTGKLVFIKLFNKKQLGGYRSARQRQNDMD